MDQQQINDITQSIKAQLKKCSEQHKIEASKIYFKIFEKQGFGFLKGIACGLYDGPIKVSDVQIGEMFNISPIKRPFVNTYLTNKLTELADKNGISLITANARIYTETIDFEPSVDLYNENVLIRKISVNELLN